MSSLFDMVNSFWVYWFGDFAEQLTDTLNLISVICVIGIVLGVLVFPILRIITGFGRRGRRGL